MDFLFDLQFSFAFSTFMIPAVAIVTQEADAAYKLKALNLLFDTRQSLMRTARAC